MEEHEFFPDQEERLERLEWQAERLNRILGRENGTEGLLHDVKSVKEGMLKIKDWIKQTKYAAIVASVAITLTLVIVGIIKLKDAISILK
jgi:hypothetical protein